MAFLRLAADTNLALTILGVWFIAALAAGATGLLASLRPSITPIVLFMLAAITVALGARVSPLREWFARLDPRWVIGFHLTRYAGLYALVLYDLGGLPRGVALYGGLIDVTMATLAVLLLLFVPGATTPRFRVVIGTWNALGLVGALANAFAATRALVSDPASVTPLLRLPFSLVPTFILPLVLATHGLLLLRVAPARPRRWSR